MPDTFSALVYSGPLKRAQATFRRDLVMLVEQRLNHDDQPSGCYIRLITDKAYWSLDDYETVRDRWLGITPPPAATPPPPTPASPDPAPPPAHPATHTPDLG